MNKENFLIFTKIFWMIIGIVCLVYLHKINENIRNIDTPETFDGAILNYSRAIKDPNNPYGHKYEKVPLEIRIVK